MRVLELSMRCVCRQFRSRLRNRLSDICNSCISILILGTYLEPPLLCVKEYLSNFNLRFNIQFIVRVRTTDYGLVQ